MRISDGSSDVCSSDLPIHPEIGHAHLDAVATGRDGFGNVDAMGRKPGDTERTAINEHLGEIADLAEIEPKRLPFMRGTGQVETARIAGCAGEIADATVSILIEIGRAHV